MVEISGNKSLSQIQRKHSRSRQTLDCKYKLTYPGSMARENRKRLRGIRDRYPIPAASDSLRLGGECSSWVSVVGFCRKERRDGGCREMPF